MLANFNRNLWVANDTDYRASVSDLINRLTAAGLVQTADAGQINPATVLKPTNTGQYRGYAMFRFNDALQGTKPIFIKIEWVSATSTNTFNNGTTNVTANWGDVVQILVSVGIATDGNGNFIGNFSQQRLIGYYPTGSGNLTAALANSAGLINSAVSGSQSGNARIMFYQGVANNFGPASNSSGWGFGGTGYPTDGNPAGGYFIVERSKDNNGDDTGDGICFIACGPPLANNSGGGTQYNAQSGTHYTVFIPFTRPLPHYTKWTLNMVNNQQDGKLTTLFENKLGAFPHYPQEHTRIHNPMVSILGYYNGDFEWRGFTVPVEMYGVDRQYRPLGGHNNHLIYNTRLHQVILPMIIWE